MLGEVRGRPFGVVGLQVLEHLDAQNQVVAAWQRIGDGAAPAVGLDVIAYLGEGEIRDVQAKGLDPAVAQRLDQHPHGAAGVEHAGWPDLPDDPIGDPAKPREPVFVSLVGPAASLSEVRSVVRL